MAPLPVDRRLHPLDVTLDELLVQIERAEAGMWQLARAGDVGACETLIRLYDVRAHALGITPPKENA